MSKHIKIYRKNNPKIMSEDMLPRILKKNMLEKISANIIKKMRFKHI